MKDGPEKSRVWAEVEEAGTAQTDKYQTHVFTIT